MMVARCWFGLLRALWVGLVLTPLFLVWGGCAGYRLGGQKPPAFEGVSSIYIPLADNLTQFPRAGALLTNHVVDALLQDGTYRVTRDGEADARLELRLREIDYVQFRPNRLDRLRSEEQTLNLTLEWKVVDAGGQLVDEGNIMSSSRYFVDNNITLSRVNALPDALQRAASRLSLRLADGF